MRPRRRLVIAVVAAALAGCGVPSDAQPRGISAEDIPSGLLDRDGAVASPSTSSPATTITVYLVSSDRLTAVQRDAMPPTAADAVQALLGGPTPAEASEGVRTAIGTSTGLAVTGMEGHVARVELGRSFTTTGTADQILAIAQIVYTVTGIAGIDAVAFSLAGRAVEVPRGDGTVTAGSLTRSDFSALAPR